MYTIKHEEYKLNKNELKSEKIIQIEGLMEKYFKDKNNYLNKIWENRKWI